MLSDASQDDIVYSAAPCFSAQAIISRPFAREVAKGRLTKVGIPASRNGRDSTG